MIQSFGNEKRVLAQISSGGYIHSACAFLSDKFEDRDAEGQKASGGLLQKLGAEESRGRRERGTGDAMKRQVQDCKGRSNRKGLGWWGGGAVRSAQGQHRQQSGQIRTEQEG